MCRHVRFRIYWDYVILQWAIRGLDRYRPDNHQPGHIAFMLSEIEVSEWPDLQLLISSKACIVQSDDPNPRIMQPKAYHVHGSARSTYSSLAGYSFIFVNSHSIFLSNRRTCMSAQLFPPITYAKCHHIPLSTWRL